MTKKSIEQKWNKEAKKLVGRKIVGARYMTLDEVSILGWVSRPIILMLDDDTLLYPSSDDEGNDAGALQSNKFNGGFPIL